MLTVSNYHYIRENFESEFPSIFGLTPAAFDHQLELLSKTGEFITPADLFENPDAVLGAAENYILITFDDGLREQFEWAKPIMDRRNIKALFFVNSINFIEKKVSLVHKIHLLRSRLSPSTLLHIFAKQAPLLAKLNEAEMKQAETHYNYDDRESAHVKFLLNFKMPFEMQSEIIEALFNDYFDEAQAVENLYFSEAQLKQLAMEGLLGSHSHSHIALGLQPSEVIETELAKAKAYLEGLSGKTIQSVSYPYGNSESCASPVPDFAKKIGHRFGFTTERGINYGNQDQLLLKRFDCNDLPGGKNYK